MGLNDLLHCLLTRMLFLLKARRREEGEKEERRRREEGEKKEKRHDSLRTRDPGGAIRSRVRQRARSLCLSSELTCATRTFVLFIIIYIYIYIYIYLYTYIIYSNLNSHALRARSSFVFFIFGTRVRYSRAFLYFRNSRALRARVRSIYSFGAENH